MQGPTKERWQALCQEAADELDPKRLMELVNEINSLLAEKEDRLKQQNTTSQHDAA